MMNQDLITRLRRKAPWLSLVAPETEGNAPPVLTRPTVVPEPPLTRQPLEQLLSAPALTRPVEPIESAPVNTEMVPLRRSVQPINPIFTTDVNAVAPPVLHRRLSGDISPTVDLPPISGVEQIGIGARPIRRRIGDPTANEEGYQEELGVYDPRKGISKKRAALKALTGFVFGGIPGAIGQTANYLLDPNADERQWRDQELARSGERLEREGQRTRQGLNDRLLRARVTDAETPNVPKPTYGWIKQDTDGDGIPDKEAYGPLEAGMTQPIRQPITRPERPRVKINVGGQELEVSPEAALGYYGQINTREQTAEEKVRQNQSQRNAKINEAKTLDGKADNNEGNAKLLDDHVVRLEAGLKTLPAFIPDPADPEKVRANPERDEFVRQIKDLQSKAETLRKEAREARIQGARARSEGEALPVREPATSTPNKAFSISAYLSRNKGATEADAKAYAAKKYPNNPIVP